MIDRHAMAAGSNARYQRLAAEGRSAWPKVDVPDDAFRSYLSERDQEGELRGADLYLACACTRGDRSALEALDALIVAETQAAVRRIDPSEAFAADVQQALRKKLLLGEGGRPAKIGDYAGRGPLRKWLRAAAMRTALNLVGDRREATESDEALLNLPAAGADPEMAYVVSRYRAEFKAAFQAATASLTSRQRNLLRLHFLQDMSIDQIGTTYRVHRSTVARWIASAREQLLRDTRAHLAEQLRLAASEVESLMGAAKSQLSVSLQRYLSPTREPHEED